MTRLRQCVVRIQFVSRDKNPSPVMHKVRRALSTGLAVFAGRMLCFIDSIEVQGMDGEFTRYRIRGGKASKVPS